MKTIKERARELWGKLPIIQEDYIPDIEDALKEQKAIDSKMFDEFLCSLRNGNMWEGREWRFQRMWREFVENYKETEE